MKPHSFKGLRYRCLVRASHSTDELSTDAQLELMHKEVAPLEMVHLDNIVKDGLTGSLPGKREELVKLLDEKKTKNDFEVLVVQRCDRLTRGGSVHGMWFEFECQKVGLRVIYAGEQIPQGRHANFIKVLQFEAAQEQAFSISQRSTQGAQLALEQGRMMPVSHTNYGCWRLYLTEDWRPLHIIRNLRDGRQQKLHVDTHEVIDTYGKVGGGGRGHYKKQKSEKVLLVSGDEHEAETVREIYHLHFIVGWGGKKIADLLNRKGIRSPQGKEWSQPQVESLYKQPCYTGCSIGHRTSSAIYHEQYPQTPKLVELDPQILATAERIPLRHRPMEEWLFKDQPHMVDFLDPKIRELAIAEQTARWARENEPNHVKKKKNKHNASDYLLSGLFFAKQDEGPLVGVLCGRVNNRTRYYRHRKGRTGYRKGSVFNGLFNAEPLEEAVLRLLGELLADAPHLREKILADIEQQSATMRMDQSQIEELQERREQIRKRVELILSTFDEKTLADGRSVINQLRAEGDNLDVQIAAAVTQLQVSNINPNEMADEVLAELTDMANNFATMPKFALRKLLETFVEKAIGDMETKNVELALVLPTWAFLQKSEDSVMRLMPSSRSSAVHETHPPFVIKLGYADCRYEKLHRGVCYECRRRAA